jgi:hypothetical protein
MTGLEEDLLGPASAAAGKGGWSLECGSLALAKELELEAPSKAVAWTTGRGDAAFEVGIPVLSRGPFTLDLPHGRIWFSKKNLEGKVPENRTGLMVAYSFARNDRILKALRVAKASPSGELRRHGLVEGTQILEVDDRPVEEIDLWEVERRLAGVYGPMVKIRWQAGKIVKFASLKTRPE